MSPPKSKIPRVYWPYLPKPQLLDYYHEDKKVCDILPTSPCIKTDPYELYRPPEGKYLDFNLSQTDAKIDKSQVKIHLQITRAEYGELNPVPPPPPKRKNIFFHGRGPCWVWVEETWTKKQLAMQVFYKKRLKQITKRRVIKERNQMAAGHYKLIKMIGPSWFIEISPNQMRAVDSLKDAILKDLTYHGLTYVKDVIGDLGLVLRPNEAHVERALKECNRCPIEFLLILYQLMNPHREEYSLNDKLLLSAVVHLTIRETLKELHIRIPSPPPKPPVPKTPKKRERKPKYPSPYLEPFTFEPDPPKHTGVYKNSHIQYPDSPYFSYIEQLKIEREKMKLLQEQDKGLKRIEDQPPKYPDLPPDLVERENEILQELATAQEEYNALAEDGQAPPLLKPSVYYPCNLITHSRSEHSPPARKVPKKKKQPKQITSEKNVKQFPKSKEVRVVATAVSKVKDESSKSSKMGSITPCGTLSAATSVSRKSHRSTSDKFIREKTTAPESTDLNVYLGDDEGFEEEEEEEEPDLALVCDCGCFADFDKEALRIPPYEFKVKKTIPTPEICDIEIRESQLIRPDETESEMCTCKQGVKEMVENAFCSCERCQKDREAWLAKKATMVISGTKKEHLDEDGLRIVEAVKEFQQCACLRNYEHAIKKFEDLKCRLRAQIKLMSMKKPFVVTGVSVGPDGKPIYQLAGVVQNPCPCLEIVKMMEEEEKRLNNMPRLPSDGRKYYITGVHQTPEGTVYSIGGTLHSADCECMEIFREYSERHTLCLDLYAEYLKKMKKDICLYLQEYEEDNEQRTGGKWGPTPFEIRDEEERIKNLPELPSDGRTYQISGVRGMAKGGKLTYEISGIKDAPENVCPVCCKCCPGKIQRKQLLKRLFSPDYEGEEEIEEEEKLQISEVPQDYVSETTSKKGKPTSIASKHTSEGSKTPRSSHKTPPTSKTGSASTKASAKASAKSSTKDDKKKVCICGTESAATLSDDLICECGDNKAGGRTNFGGGNRRIMIFEKIPTKWKEQQMILKQALDYLAEDGYPLAKIPDCEKLPIFKLWFQLRSGKYFTMDDREVYKKRSKQLWRHYDKCRRKNPLPELPVSKTEGAKLTYRESARVKKMVEVYLDTFYRQLRQNNIDLSREFFPTLFTYEFPTPSFRDCFFSYCPAKEEHCICINL